MKNETRLAAQDLALYLGCEAQFVTAYNYDLKAGKLIGVRDEPRGVHCSIIPTGKSQPELAWVYAHSMPDEFKPAMPFSEDAQLVFPILRPLSDMTEEEENEVQSIVDQNGFGYNAIQGAGITRFLLSRQFDLFGWIEAGLAIDKTKITTP